MKTDFPKPDWGDPETAGADFAQGGPGRLTMCCGLKQHEATNQKQT